MTAAKTEIVTVPNGASVSNIVDCSKWILTSITLPATLTGTAVTFNNSFDGQSTTQYAVNSSSATAYSIPATGNVGKTLIVDVNVARGLNKLQLSTGSNEGAARDFILNFREGDSAI